MALRKRWSKKTDELVRYIATGTQPSLRLEIGYWIDNSARFAVFAAANQDKIRKKLSTAADAEVRLDVRAELLVAHALLSDRRLEVSFEAYGARKPGPDLTVTYRANQRFNLEVTRLRSAADTTRLIAIIVTKLRQMPSELPNVLVIVGRDLSISDDALADAVRQLRQRATERDDAFFLGRGLKDAHDFAARIPRLSGVLVVDESSVALFHAIRGARHPLPTETASRVLQAFA